MVTDNISPQVPRMSHLFLSILRLWATDLKIQTLGVDRYHMASRGDCGGNSRHPSYSLREVEGTMKLHPVAWTQICLCCCIANLFGLTLTLGVDKTTQTDLRSGYAQQENVMTIRQQSGLEVESISLYQMMIIR